MLISKNFDLKEFIPPDIYSRYGDSSIWFIDNRVITICQWLRDYFNRSLTINNWHIGGTYKESGLRSFETTTGAQASQHKFGRAADIKIEGITPDEVRKTINMLWITLRRLGLTTVESNTPTWTHIDVRFTGLNDLFKVTP
jgi:hypothetical protein